MARKACQRVIARTRLSVRVFPCYQGRMARARCPKCRKEIPDGEKPAAAPFCSDRCRLLDLGSWLSGDYVIPGPPSCEASAAPEEDGPETEH